MKRLVENLFISLIIQTLSLICSMFTNHFALLAYQNRIRQAIPESPIDFWTLATYFFIGICIISLVYFIKFAIEIEKRRGL